jgi:hypothetical protein
MVRLGEALAALDLLEWRYALAPARRRELADEGCLLELGDGAERLPVLLCQKLDDPGRV